MLLAVHAYAHVATEMSSTVIVIGAGIGGLALARLLQLRGIPVRVYERDASLEARAPGYSLTLQQGMRVVRAMQLEHALLMTRPCVSLESFRLRHDGTVARMSRRVPADVPQFIVPRGTLRRLLYDALAPGTVHFGHTCVEYRDEGERTAATFERTDGECWPEDGTRQRTVAARCLVGADGLRSFVRAQLDAPHDTEPHALGLAMINGLVRVPNTDAVLRETFTNSRVIEALGDGARLFVKPYDSVHVMWQCTLPWPAAAAVASRGSDQRTQWLQYLKQRISKSNGWDVALARLVASTAASTVRVRDLCDVLPHETARCSDERSHLALVGDAWHTMTPYKGQGANTALEDAFVLAHYLADTSLSTGASLRAYEENRLSRVRGAVLASRTKTLQAHGETIERALCVHGVCDLDRMPAQAHVRLLCRSDMEYLAHLWRIAAPVDTGAAQALCTIDLSHCRLTALPPVLCDQLRLRRLVVSYNQLTALPASLTRLTRLEQLELRHNRLTALGIEPVFALTTLRTLRLTFNAINGVLSERLGQLTQLRELCMSHNGVTAFPASTTRLTHLRVVYAGCNQLHDAAQPRLYDTIGALTALRVLKVYGNPCTLLPFVALRQLAALQVSRQQWVDTLARAGVEHVPPAWLLAMDVLE